MGKPKNWFYSHLDIDAGTSLKSGNDGETIELILKKAFVHRNRIHLWRRLSFNNEHHKEDFLDNFNYKIYSHPIRGARYNKIEGNILWRDW